MLAGQGEEEEDGEGFSTAFTPHRGRVQVSDRVLGTSVVVVAPLTRAQCGHKPQEAASTAQQPRGTWPRVMQRHREGTEQQHHCTSWINTRSSELGRVMSEELPPEG